MKASVDLIPKIIDITGEEREKVIAGYLDSNDVPEFLFNFKPITIILNNNVLTYYVSPDYLALGEDSDYLLIPANPKTVEDHFLSKHDLLLPTTKMSRQIFEAATHKIIPMPIQPNSQKTKLFVEIDNKIKSKRFEHKIYLTDFVAGHKKDVVLSNLLLRKENRGNVGLYGWFTPKDGKPIQPLYCGHWISYVDYSHGFRLVKDECLLNGQTVSLKKDIMRNPNLCLLVHDEVLSFLSY
jgi:hypothetical protein